MTAVIVGGIVFASVVVYFGIGWILAKRDLLNAWERARQIWGDSSIVRDSVKEQLVFLVLFWPVLAPIRAFSSQLNDLITQGDPAELRRQLAKREQHIARLERELGIGRTST